MKIYFVKLDSKYINSENKNDFCETVYELVSKCYLNKVSMFDNKLWVSIYKKINKTIWYKKKKNITFQILWIIFL